MREFPPTKESLHRGQLLHILQQLIVMGRPIEVVAIGSMKPTAQCFFLCRVDRGLVSFVQLWSLSDSGRVAKSKFSILLDTLLSLTSLPPARALLPRALMGASFSGGVAPFLAVVCGLFIGG